MHLIAIFLPLRHSLLSQLRSRGNVAASPDSQSQAATVVGVDLSDLFVCLQALETYVLHPLLG